MRLPFGRRRRREEVLDEPFPDLWRRQLASRWPMWSRLDDDERALLEQRIQEFLVDVRFEAAQGFRVGDEMRVLVAAQASLLALHLPDDVWGRVTSVILHPRTVVLHGQRNLGNGGLASDDPYAISGQAHIRGPVLLAWPTVAFEARHPEVGQNVVMHEFAHQLDMLDGSIDGTPPLPDRSMTDRWVAVCTEAFERVRRGEPSGLREYAATDVGEFFAVAVETFFSVPQRLRRDEPALYGILVEYFGQDPAAREPDLPVA